MSGLTYFQRQTNGILSSSTLGSITMADAFKSMPVPAYKISKAALSMLTVQYAHQYADDGFTFLGISPGVSQDIVLIATALLI